MAVWTAFLFGVVSLAFAVHYIEAAYVAVRPPPTEADDSAGGVLGHIVKTLLESAQASDILGVPIRVGTIDIQPLHGVVKVDGLVIGNPKGYFSEYMVKVEEVHIDLDMGRLFNTGFKQLKVDVVKFKGVNLIYERAITTSNVEDFVEKLTKKKEKERKEKEAAKAAKAAEAANCESDEPDGQWRLPWQQGEQKEAAGEASKAEGGKFLFPWQTGEIKVADEAVTAEEAGNKSDGQWRWPWQKGEKKEGSAKLNLNANGMQFTLHKVAAQTIGVKIASGLTLGLGVQIVVGDIIYDDFDVQHTKAQLAVGVVPLLITTILKSVIATAVGKDLADKIGTFQGSIANHAKGALVGAANKTKEGVGKIGDGMKKVLPFKAP